ncbi:GNAT family N-acetyltransferase [Enterococcus sp. BWR-S5]|uniref:GNAT family N-acetyltransferase n=1 Tax=Enterococcus sp. BWR-S5 TaxID=2787714 RepID=UPI001923073C|nr:GNAT family N-acetyltransferase [Enterococcus sp. BWR-S5]MBL1226024.1 GNAT family N-acetyltransferase [Enterococcus sp. BWR-S5]
MIRQALAADTQAIRELTHRTIRSIYPHYYPQGAVSFFLTHHSSERIAEDIRQQQVFVLEKEGLLGTVTLKNNEICRLFVQPEHQGLGYGRALIEFAEATISTHSELIRLDASLPSKIIYLNRGYQEVNSNCILADNGDYLCYDTLEKRI